MSFRKLVPSLDSAERATHLIHPYPAKLLMHIPHFFLSSKMLSETGDIVLDPFCGSGTVLLESMLAGRNAIGADSNPLARLISKVKTTLIDLSFVQVSTRRLLHRIPLEPDIEPPDVVNLSHWFYPHVTKQLLCLLQAINKTIDKDVREFFLICFSSCLRKVSLADPRLSVPVRLQYGQYPFGHWLREKTDKHLASLRRVNVLNQFLEIVRNNYARLASFKKIGSTEAKVDVTFSDARNLEYNSMGSNLKKKLPDEAVDLIITSPPYVGAQKYIRASSLSLGWLGFSKADELRKLEELNIGREHYRKETYSELVTTGIRDADKCLENLRCINPLRAHIAATYLLEMRGAFVEMERVLKPCKYLVLVAANNQICGKEFQTVKYLTTIAEECGFSLKLRLIDAIRSRGLMTKRNKTASVIVREWAMIFQKGVNGHGRA